MEFFMYNVDEIPRKSLERMKENKYSPDWSFRLLVSEGLHSGKTKMRFFPLKIYCFIRVFDLSFIVYTNFFCREIYKCLHNFWQFLAIHTSSFKVGYIARQLSCYNICDFVFPYEYTDLYKTLTEF